jgi:hypothetical protein
MGRQKKVECRICLKTMRSDTLKRHMKQHEKKPYQKVEIEYNFTPDYAAIGNLIDKDVSEYQRKLELGGVINKHVLEKNAPTAGLRREFAEALQLFNNRGQVKDVKLVEWRPWQKELLEHVNIQTARRVIWVVGERGDEGKDFFQNHIEEQYGKQRVCAMPFAARSKDILHAMLQVVDITTDIFLFNIPKDVNTRNISVKLLENIKDGKALAEKFVSKIVRFRTPNVVMVFSNGYPDTRRALTSGRWLIFKINREMQLEDVTEAKLKRKCGGGDANKNGKNTFIQRNYNESNYDWE